MLFRSKIDIKEKSPYGIDYVRTLVIRHDISELFRNR